VRLGTSNGPSDAILPDGRVELVFHYGEPFRRLHPDGRVEVQPRSMLVGQMLGPVVVTPGGPAGVAGIRLQPAAARGLLRLPVGDVTTHIVDLETVFPSLGEIREQLATAASDRARVAALEDWLLSNEVPSPRPELEAAIGAIVRTRGRIGIEAIATPIGFTRRRLERAFQDDVGLSPKQLARIVRLQAALGRVRAGEALAEVALACGYYDQAHMALDFRRLAALSPAGWRHYSGELAELFIDR
jgi:AraC-like DNA-binding protein